MPQSPGALALRLPLGLINALFRPQLFDVNNALVLVSALEMTYITFVLLGIVRRRGIRVFGDLRRSPFLLMCSIVVAIGCSFVGVVTLNLGSLARYRVPFLPFYGALLAILSEKLASLPVAEPAEASPRISLVPSNPR